MASDGTGEHSLNVGELGEVNTEGYHKGWRSTNGPPTMAGITVATDGRDWRR
jgi:hypothetical protein